MEEISGKERKAIALIYTRMGLIVGGVAQGLYRTLFGASLLFLAKSGLLCLRILT